MKRVMNFGVITPIGGLDAKACEICARHPLTNEGTEIFESIGNGLNWLVRCCRRAIDRYGGLDLEYLFGCSVSKQLTLDARKRLHIGRDMESDRAARALVVRYVVDEILER